MKPLKPGDKLRPIVGIQVNMAPAINLAIVRFEYIKYPGQKPFVTENYSLDAGALEGLAQQFLQIAKELRSSSAANPKTHLN